MAKKVKAKVKSRSKGKAIVKRSAKVDERRHLATRRNELVIPNTSVLAPLVRKGTEGLCLACSKPVHAHFGHRGVWIGCQDKNVSGSALFVLVPISVPTSIAAAVPTLVTSRAVGKPVVAPAVTAPKAVASPKQPKAVAADHGLAHRAAVTAMARLRLAPRYVYQVKDKRRTLPSTFTKAILDAYNGLRRAAKPVTVEQAAKLAKHPREANRRALNMLLKAGLVRRTAVAA